MLAPGFVFKTIHYVRKNAREFVRISTRGADGAPKVELRVVRFGPDGRMSEDGRAFCLPAASIDDLISSLREAQRALAANRLAERV